MRVSLVLALTSFFVVVAVPQIARADFSCQTAAEGKKNSDGVARCVCVGTDNCSNMRKSQSCASNLDCGSDGKSSTVCTCVAKFKGSAAPAPQAQPRGKSRN